MLGGVGVPIAAMWILNHSKPDPRRPNPTPKTRAQGILMGLGFRVKTLHAKRVLLCLGVHQDAVEDGRRGHAFQDFTAYRSLPALLLWNASVGS